MDKTKIDWADSSWNPVTGCLHECEYCYARKMANRYKCHSSSYENVINGLGDNLTFLKGESLKEIDRPYEEFTKDGSKLRIVPYPFNFDPTFHRYRLDDYKNKKGRTIFVGSMCDLFGEWVPDEWIRNVFAACEAAPQHRYLFLTKNPTKLGEKGLWRQMKKDNYWIGTSITGREDFHRARELLKCTGPYHNTFLSIEPLLSEIDNSFDDIYAGCTVKWVIIGAETGNRKDKVVPKREWIAEIYAQCKVRNIPVFMKESLRGIMKDSFVQEFPW